MAMLTAQHSRIREVELFLYVNMMCIYVREHDVWHNVYDIKTQIVIELFFFPPCCQILLLFLVRQTAPVDTN